MSVVIPNKEYLNIATISVNQTPLSWKSNMNIKVSAGFPYPLGATVTSEGVNFANQAYRGSFFKPNIVFLNLIDRENYMDEFNDIIDEAARLELGFL